MSKTVSFPTTLQVRDACLCLHAQRAARRLARRFDAALRPASLTNGQFSLLMSLNRPEPPTMGPVAEFLALDRTSLTAMLKPLVRRGLVAVGVDGDDRRSRRILLTAGGHDALAAALPLWQAAQAATEAGLAEEGGADRLRTLLRRLPSATGAAI